MAWNSTMGAKDRSMGWSIARKPPPNRASRER